MNATHNLHVEFSGPSGQEPSLKAYCMNPQGRWNPSSLRLNTCLGDDRGSFQWGGQNFTQMARNIRFNPEEGDSHVPVLRAELRDDAGEYHERDVNLAEKINNRDGYLQFSG
ncbi:Cyanovirin-N [Aspergillus leporis]|uniref:Cyanovirin-N n=1 Tax=Aspergillus leporis TaxID=41062 RepID=A0A5N5WGG3_9EURO|nr:Cyanovirin-N [Aspergillus leporis]